MSNIPINVLWNIEKKIHVHTHFHMILCFAIGEKIMVSGESQKMHAFIKFNIFYSPDSSGIEYPFFWCTMSQILIQIYWNIAK